MKVLKFDEEHIPSVKEGSKRTTWRIDTENFQAYYNPLDKIKLQDSEGATFGIGQILWTKSATIATLSKEDMKYHESYDTISDIVDALNKYYPDKEIEPTSEVKVIRFIYTRDEDNL